MATKWVSLDKLRYAISKIHTLLQGKVDKVDGKGLSANDLTAALKGNYDAAYTHSQAAHAPADAEKNIIVGVQVNGSDLTPDGSRKVNVRVPTGALAGKSQVSETDLDDALKEKVNSASEGNHSHNNKAVLDQIEQADLDKLDGIAAGANKYTHPTSSGSKHIPTGGASGQILRWSADGTAVWGADNDTKYTDMTGASASAAGKAGLVPAPAAGGQAKYLRGDGTWQTPPDTKYSPATQSTNGLMSAADKTSLTDSAQLLPTRSRAILPRCTVTRVLSQMLQSCLPPVRWRATSMTSRLRPPMALPARTLRGTAQPGMRSAVRSQSKSVPTLRSTRYSPTLPLDEVTLYEMGISSAVELRIVENRGPLCAALPFPYCCHYCRRRIHVSGGQGEAQRYFQRGQ